MPDLPSDAEVVTDLMQPLMAYAELLKTAGHPSQSKLVWALLEDHYRKLTALLGRCGSRPRTWPWKRPAGRCEYGGNIPQNP